MLFNFTLDPLECIEPWGFPEEYQLHWFGLTLGQYWLQAGDTALLEYSPHARGPSGEGRYCHYQVARLYEDIMEIAPEVLEPVPAPLVRCISRESSHQWNEVFSSWYSDREDDPPRDILEAATAWTRKRFLDTCYLSPSTGLFHLWSDESLVHIEWDNRGKLIDGTPAWTALCGSWQLPKNDFKNELRSFHQRLMQQMGERVDAIAAGALRTLRPDIHINLEILQKEHAQRCRTIETTLQDPTPPTDWPSVHEAVLTIERRSRTHEATIPASTDTIVSRSDTVR